MKVGRLVRHFLRKICQLFPILGPVAGLADPGASLLELQEPSTCFAGACPRDGSVEATHPTPALFYPCWEPPVPSWARWPRATLPSEWRRELEGLPRGWVEKKAVLTLGGGQAIRNGLWPPELGGRQRDRAEHQHPGPSRVWLICSSGVNALLLKPSFPQPLLGHSLEPAQLPTFLASDRLCGGYDLALLDSLWSWLCWQQKAVRDMLYPPSLKDVQHPWS